MERRWKVQNFKYELSNTLFRLFELTGQIGYYNLFNNIEFDKEHILENDGMER